MVRRDPKDKFPLWLHPRGQWCKKIKGRFYYFGTDRDAALAEYVRVRDDLQAGRKPRPKSDGALTVADAANAFLSHKRERVESGELTSKMWGEYYHVAEQVVGTFGKDRPVADLSPEDFGRLRAATAKRLGPSTLSRFITTARTLFGYAFKAELIEVPVRYGSQFDKPPKRVLRLNKHIKGPKLIPAPDLWRLLDAARPQLRAMLLVCLNCGFGATDCANLTRTVLARRPGWIDAPRVKTGTPRRCPLWPETLEALTAAHAARPDPKDPADADCVFLTIQGRRVCGFKDRGSETPGYPLDAAAGQFRRLARKVGVKVPGGLYVMRHIFRTVADEMKDRPAIDMIMGHADQSMASYYRELIDDARLVAVTDYVRDWLLEGKPDRV